MVSLRTSSMASCYLVLLWCLTILPATMADVEVTIDEEKPVGFVVVRLTDYSSIYNGLDPSQIKQITYFMLDKNSAPANLFNIGHTSGVITVAKKIDREDVCDQTEKCEKNFNVAIQIAPENGATINTVITVNVIVTDINDNAPRFPTREVTLEVSEGAKVGTELKISGAKDPDSKPEFTVQHYNSTPAIDTFSIRPTTNPDGSSTINLRLEKELDREKVDSYDFNIIAYDGGDKPQSDYLHVKVVVTDDNDNSPEFVRGEYSWSIKEDEKIGAVVGQVTAVDRDVGDYGRITYSFSQISESTVRGIFAINSTTGVITLANDLSSFKLPSSPLYMYVDAKDGGNPQRSTQTLVSVDIMDSGNNAPIVRINTATTGDASTLTIPESAKRDHFVAFVHVEDSDEGSNGQVTCSLLSVPDFKLNPVPGKGYTLLLNRDVNREDKDSYQVLITCQDGGSPALEKAANLTVNITDINDNEPVFLTDVYSARVPENRAAGHFVAQVSAKDLDIGPNAELSYHLSPKAARFIRIQSRTGVISTSRPLDREANATLRFQVFATDNGAPERMTGTAEISITVTDVNDNAPEFNNTKFSFFISEKTPNKTIIGNLTAHDVDAGINSEFEFYFGGSTSGDMPLPITVLPNGSLVVSGLLDHETKHYYSFTVLVQDRGSMPKSNAAPVEINILDENDNDPVILFPTSKNHTIVISTYPENGMVLGRIIAYDVDEGSASNLRFSIYEGNEDQAFAISPGNGELIMKDIERLQNPQEYLLSIKVEDSDVDPRNATTQLRIDVHFANKSEPHFQPEDEESRDQYVIIVGVIGGATFVLSVIIISAIVIILRSEKTRHRDSSGSFFKNKFFGGSSTPMTPQSKMVEQPVLPKSQPHNSSSVSGDPNGLILSPGNLGGGVAGGVRRHEDGGKKVSFSLDLQGDFHDQSHDSTGSEKHLQLSPPLDQNVQWKKYAHPDDINSDTSGESGTCDSGRGTSDEDIKFDHSPTKGFPRNIPGDGSFSPREPLLNHHIPQKPSTVRAVPLMPGLNRIHASTPPVKTGHPGFLDNVFDGGSSNSINRSNVVIPGNKGRSSYHGQRGQSPYQQSSSNASLRQPRLPPSHHTQQQQHHQQQHHHHRNNPPFNDVNNPDLLRPPSSMSYAQQGSVISIDDDASTTTSGSYVINPDEVRLEGLLGKDVIV